ncbi:MAG: sugar kinase [Mucilaginibacter sp.]|nr:sugar kinase [Mucilaginibacter sp.]
MEGKILSFGELLLRICPDLEENYLKENKLEFFIGGAELNVASALALWGLDSSFITALPDNYFSRQIVNFLKRQKNVNTDGIIFNGERLGLYYLRQGHQINHTAVIYDRENSAFSDLAIGDVNWDKIFDGVCWFHFSAICPALNQKIADVCLEALQMASKKGIYISIDLNYRAKLWKYGKGPAEVMPELVKYCDLIMGNIWAANAMLAIDLNEALISGDNKNSLLTHARLTSESICHLFPKCKAVANTFRFDHLDGINYYSTLYSARQFNYSMEYFSDKTINRVGSGDCYMAGLIYGYYQRMPLKDILEFATAAAFSKLFIESDATNRTVPEIKKMMFKNAK